MGQRILVWDLPTRVFHWSLAASFAGAYLTANSAQWQSLHLLCGYLLLALIAFRLVWGIVGSHHARFASFVPGLVTTIAYLRSLAGGRAQRFTGHNPVGAIALVLMLALGIATGTTGWVVLNAVGGYAFEKVHGALANAMLAVVTLHIAGVILASFRHRENFTGGMISGHKTGAAEEAIKHSHGPVALLLVLAMGLFGWALTAGKLPLLWDRNIGEQAVAAHEHRSDQDKHGD